MRVFVKETLHDIFTPVIHLYVVGDDCHWKDVLNFYRNPLQRSTPSRLKDLSLIKNWKIAVLIIIIILIGQHFDDVIFNRALSAFIVRIGHETIVRHSDTQAHVSAGGFRQNWRTFEAFIVMIISYHMWPEPKIKQEITLDINVDTVEFGQERFRGRSKTDTSFESSKGFRGGMPFYFRVLDMTQRGKPNIIRQLKTSKRV